MFLVRNWDNNQTPNPSGLLYKAVIQYTQPPKPANVWWLNSIDHPAFPAPLEMEQTPDIQIDNVSFTGEPVIWLADAHAEHGVTFPSGIWTLSLHTTANWENAWTATVGEWIADNSTFVPFAFSQTPSWNGDSSRLTVLLNGNLHTIGPGNYLALQITNASGGIIVTDYKLCGSYLAPPHDSPVYPLPELSAGLLLALGLAGIAGFLFIKRRNTRRMGTPVFSK
jgi:hypothetical protein